MSSPRSLSVAVALVLAGCGGNSPPPTSAPVDPIDAPASDAPEPAAETAETAPEKELELSGYLVVGATCHDGLMAKQAVADKPDDVTLEPGSATGPTTGDAGLSARDRLLRWAKQHSPSGKVWLPVPIADGGSPAGWRAACADAAPTLTGADFAKATQRKLAPGRFRVVLKLADSGREKLDAADAASVIVFAVGPLKTVGETTVGAAAKAGAVTLETDSRADRLVGGPYLDAEP